jgi:hypothetical protein
VSSSKPNCFIGFSTCEAFVAKFNTLSAGASSRVFATYLGGSGGGDNAAQGVAVDSAGNGYVTGFTSSADFPTVNPIYGCPGCASSNDSMFLTEFSPSGAILFSTFLGGSAVDSDQAHAIALDSAGAIYLTGTAGSNNLPPVLPIPGCLNPVQSTPVSNFVAFALRLSGGAGSGLATSTALTSSVNPSLTGQSVTFTATVSSSGGVCGTSPTGTVTFKDGAIPLGTIQLTNSVAALPPTSTLSVGNHNITATYNGDASFSGSTSAILIQQVLAPGAPVVTTQPLSQAACAGQNVTFTAVTSGSPTPTVQWQVSVSNGPFTNIPGATSTTLSFVATVSQSGNQYQAVFTNASGIATTSAVTLTVDTAPLITTNPVSQTVASGQNVTFTAAASGIPSPSVQWQVSVNNGPFTNFPGANSPSLTFAASNSQNGNQYQAVFTDPCGVATTTAATLTVNVVIQVNESIKVTDTPAPVVAVPPSVTLQPTGQAVCAGQTATFMAAATGTPAPTVQWQVSVSNGPFANIPGATSSTLSFIVSAPQNGNLYRAVFTNIAGQVTSSPATLTINTAPVVTVNPAGQTVNSGQGVTFTGAAIGTPPPTIQWQVSVNNGPFTNIPGADASSLTFTADSSQNGNQYRAVFTDPCGLVITAAALLTVNIVIQVNESIKVTDSPAVNNTSSGNNVVVAPVDSTTGTSPVTLTFSSVTQPGLTTLTTSSGGPPPPTGFQFGNPAVYYNLATTAVFTGSIQVCINYTGISFVTPPGPRLLHFVNGSWVDSTTSVDTTHMIVCGSVTSLSPFALFRQVDIIPPTTHATLSPAANAAGWNNTNVTITLNSVDEPGGSGVKQITYSASGAQTISSTVVAGGSASVLISVEGVTTIRFFGTDNAGNVEPAQSLTIKVDKTPPTISCTANPNQLWPPDNRLVAIQVSVSVSDALSGPAGFTLQSVTSNEPDSGAGDIQGWAIGTVGTTGQLRAERSGSGNGRIYTLSYQGADRAGNTATCAATVTVPHDQGQP